MRHLWIGDRVCHEYAAADAVARTAPSNTMLVPNLRDSLQQ